jgi:hypothetical protein
MAGRPPCIIYLSSSLNRILSLPTREKKEKPRLPSFISSSIFARIAQDSPPLPPFSQELDQQAPRRLSKRFLAGDWQMPAAPGLEHRSSGLRSRHKVGNDLYKEDKQSIL